MLYFTQNAWTPQSLRNNWFALLGLSCSFQRSPSCFLVFTWNPTKDFMNAVYQTSDMSWSHSCLGWWCSCCLPSMIHNSIQVLGLGLMASDIGSCVEAMLTSILFANLEIWEPCTSTHPRLHSRTTTGQTLAVQGSLPRGIEGLILFHNNQ